MSMTPAQRIALSDLEHPILNVAQKIDAAARRAERAWWAAELEALAAEWAAQHDYEARQKACAQRLRVLVTEGRAR
jgi:hypothetical protein